TSPFWTEEPLEMDRPEYTIGIVTGAGSENLVRRLFLQAEIKSYKGPTELILGLEQGQVDAIVYNGIVLENAQREKPDKLYILKTPVGVDEICMTVSPKTKIKTLHSEVTEFMEIKKEAGYLDDLYDRWTSGNGYVMPEIPDAQDPKAVITVGTQGTVVPYSFYQGNELIGMCVELARTFAFEYGYALDFRVEDTTSQLADGEFGRIDMTDGGFFYTKERAEQVDFVFPAIHDVPTEMMVLAESGSRTAGFLDTMRINFEKTFIRENRWMLVLDGLRVTLLLSCCSLVLGTIFSCLFCTARRSRVRWVSLIMRAFIELINGMPIVLFLMICFYVIFSGTGLSETIVAVIAFATDFGCRGAVTLDSGIESVEKGEIEAAEAMGMSPFQIHRLIVFPQAVRNIFDVYKTQVVNLIKSTSVVGYITVQDLTKVSDIIRARTYEAFFS
ncbi:MAG: ABC transporter permease subunit, partial [Eubacteriales bacterium]|nr:ABC transporter permease subunit [Eubacteriales bacterium]